MKKFLLSGLFAVASAGMVLAQGYSPAPPNGLPDGEVGTAYSQVINFTIPDSVTVDPSTLGIPIPGIPPFAAAVDTVKMAVDGLPNGLAATCDNGNCEYLSGATGTITISGTPSEGGSFLVAITTLTSGNGTVEVPLLGSTPVSFPGTVQGQSIPAAPGLLDSDDYNMDIAGGGSSVLELDLSTFDVLQNMPNPFGMNTQIKFSSPNPAEVEFNVYDMLGKQVHNSTTNAEVGENSIEFNAANLEQGAYFYTITNGDKVYTKRMIVSRK